MTNETSWLNNEYEKINKQYYEKLIKLKAINFVLSMFSEL
jgi:hypothetical protein